jgi:eukaryotic-like serine/threonine-protein kinase
MGVAEGEGTPFDKLFDNITRFSNFTGKGPVRIGTFQGMTPYGVFDMAGNVREWCWNETRGRRTIRGGAWNDNVYMACDWTQTPAFERSERNGIRCVLYPERGTLPDSLFLPMSEKILPDFYKMKPASDAIFAVYREQFAYDNIPLNARVESKRDNPEGWARETITLDAAYGGERIIAHLFLPKNTKPPYQTVIYFPGGGSLWQRSSKDIDNYYEVPMFLSFLLKNGRAVLYPVYKGTFERSNPKLSYSEDTSRLYTEWQIQDVRDFKRCVDYLETRRDIDTSRLAYYGLSWGAGMGLIITAVDDRVKASVLQGVGLSEDGREEVEVINYVGRVKIPTLMLNGRYDKALPELTSQRPLFDLLGTPPEHKRMMVYETDHFIPRVEYVKETLAWLDRYLGPVK